MRWHKNLHSSTIHNCPQVEITLMPINSVEMINKLNENGQSLITHNNMVESHRQY